MRSNPQDTFNVLLSLSQTFTRFAPETELIYDDIQQFASDCTPIQYDSVLNFDLF